MLADALLAARLNPSTTLSHLRWQPSLSTFLALVVWLAVTWHHTAYNHFPLVLVSEGLLLALSFYLLRVPEVSVLSQLYILLGEAVWVGRAFSTSAPLPWWNPVLMLVLAITVSEWWERQRVLALPGEPGSDWALPRRLPQLAKNAVLVAGVQTAILFVGGWSLDTTLKPAPHLLYVAFALGVVMLADALLAHQKNPSDPAANFRPQPSLSTSLALVVWLGVTWHDTSPHNFPLVIAAECLVLTFSFYLLRMPELPLLSQVYLFVAQVGCIFYLQSAQPLLPWWNPALLIGMTVFMSHWWQKQTVLSIRSELTLFWQGLYALSAVGVLYFWFAPRLDPASWLALTSLLAVGLTFYGVVTRAWWLAAFGQLFIVVGCAQFVWQLSNVKPAWGFPLAPIAALIALSFGTTAWFRKNSDGNPRLQEPLLQLARIYRWVAVFHGPVLGLGLHPRARENLVPFFAGPHLLSAGWPPTQP
jgi:hypothetical protein